MKSSLITFGVVVSLSLSCSKKDAEDDTSETDSSGTVAGGGNGGRTSTKIEVGTGLTFTDITKEGFTITWTAATSPVTPQEQLEYQLVTAETTEAIATIAQVDAVAPADIVLPYAVGTLNYTVTDLSPSTTRAYAVIVKDAVGNTALYPAASVTTLAADAPTSGTGITFGLITDTSFSIYWGAATSTVSEQAKLQYRVVLAANANLISTVAGATGVTGSNVVLDWTANRTGATYIPSGVVKGAQTYAVAVLVRDENGVAAIYTPQTVTTLPHKLVFATSRKDPSTLGISGGVIQADTYCNNEKPAGRGTFKAMIAIPTVREACRTHANCMLGQTVLTNDSIGWVMTPSTTYENKSGDILWTTNAAAIMASNPALPGSISTSGLPAWTGLNSNWTTGSNCNNWTSNSASDNGAYGHTAYYSSPVWGLGDKACNGDLQAGGGYLYPVTYCVEQ
jgi:hypothetical protein